MSEPTREDDERDLRILQAIDNGLPVSVIAETEGVCPDHIRELLREVAA